MNKKIHICFVVPFAYSLYNTVTNYAFGGAEVRSSLFARALAKHDNFEMSVIVNNYGQPPIEHYDGVTVYRHSGYHDSNHWLTRYRNQLTNYIEPKPGLPYFQVKQFHVYAVFLIAILGMYRFFGELRSRFIGSSQITLFDRVLPLQKYRVYDVVNADIYCVFGTRALGAEVAGYCKAQNKKFVLFGASDRNFTALHADDALKERDEMSVRTANLIIESADLIITQTQQQAGLLKQNFGRESAIITNPIDLESVVSTNRSGYALWVGKSDGKKNPTLLLDIAKRVPDIPFIMILNNTNQELFDQCLNQCPDNVEIIESVPFAEIEKYFAGAIVLINTSPLEGFANTFLQAGKYNVPILSYRVNPDEYITEWNCGVVADGDEAVMIDTLHRLQADPEWRHRLGENHYGYVQANHNLADKANTLKEYLLALQ